MFNNKFDFGLGYKKKVSGLLLQQTYSGSYFSQRCCLPKVNIGNMENTGFELTAGYHGLVGKDLRFDISGNLTTYNNKIVDIPGAGYFDGPQIRNVTPTRNSEGHPVGAFFGYQVERFFQSRRYI
jgi:hypothetical protein